MEERSTFTIKSSEPVYRGFSSITRHHVEVETRAGTAERYTREVEHHGHGAAVLAYDAGTREAVLVRQLRLPLAVAGEADPYLLEAIAGLLDIEGEGAEATVRREAVEEAGLELTHVEAAGYAFGCPGISTERLHLFLAEVDLDAALTGPGGGAEGENEDIEVVRLPLADLARMADTGALRDLKTLALTQTLRLRRPDLFEPGQEGDSKLMK